MFNLLFKAVVASLAAVGASTAWRAVSQAPCDSPPRAKAPDVQPWPTARLARIDHDLRTPIGTIANTIELLRELAARSDDAREACDVIERQVRRLTTLSAELHEIVASRGASDLLGDENSRTGAEGARKKLRQE